MGPLLIVAAYATISVNAFIRTDPPGGLIGRAKPLEPEVIRLEELWRVGEEDNDVIFGEVSSTIVDRDHRLYVLDRQAKQVSAFDANGKFVRTIGRVGEGPGEFREPRGLVLMPDGSIGVVREEPPAILCYRPSDGSFLTDFHFTAAAEYPFQRLSRVVSRGRTFVAMVVDVRQSTTAMAIIARLMRFDAAGRFLEQCDSISNEFNFAQPIVRERYDIMWQVGPDERVVVNNGLDYSFDVYGVDGRRYPSFGRGYQPLKRTSAEIDSVKAYYRRVGNMGDATLEVFDRVRDVAWFSIDDDGRVWVLSSRGRVDAPEDSLGLFDVYEQSGALRHTIDLKGEGGPRDAYLMTQDRFFVLRREPAAVIAYRFEGLRR